MRRRLVLPIGAAVLALAIAGCGGSSSGSSKAATSPSAAPSTTGPNPNGPEVSPSGDIPDNQAFVPYRGPGFVVSVPEGWAQSTTASGVQFSDKLNSITARSQQGGALTAAQARSTTVAKLAAAREGFVPGSVTVVRRKAGPAVRITYRATGTTDPVTGKTPTDAVEQYVFVHNGKRLTLTLSGPKGADNVDPWRIVTDSVRWTP